MFQKQGASKHKENKSIHQYLHCFHSKHPRNLFLEQFSIFRSSGLELQLGHPIRSSLREISA